MTRRDKWLWWAPVIITLVIWALQAYMGARDHPAHQTAGTTIGTDSVLLYAVFFVVSAGGFVATILLLGVHLALVPIVAGEHGWRRGLLAVLYGLANVTAALLGGAYIYFAAGGAPIGGF